MTDVLQDVFYYGGIGVPFPECDFAGRDFRKSNLSRSNLKQAVLRGANGSAGVGLFELFDLDPASSRISNISTRGEVGTGSGVMIGGFIIGGEEPTKVVVRAIGPSLSAENVPNPLFDPLLELYDGNGSLIFTNDNWRTTQEEEILATGVAPSADSESAIVATLTPGGYTAMVRDAGSASGVALVEVYNLETK